MAKKKTGKAGAGAPPEKMPAQEARTKGDRVKIGVVILLAAVTLCLVYVFLLIPEGDFGARVDAETFKSAFDSAGKVYIVMDVRGVADPNVSDHVLQCGVDFAGSTGMGGKNATIFSFTDEGGEEKGCIAGEAQTLRPVRECLSQLKDGVTIYVKSGPGGAEYFSRGMVVTVGANYTMGTCGIRRV